MLLKFEWEYKEGRKILEKKGLLREIISTFDCSEKFDDNKAKVALREKGWETTYKFLKEFSRGFSYDAYKDGVAFEYEHGYLWKARWDWMKFQLGYNIKLDGGHKRLVDVGVIAIKPKTNGMRGDRVQRELDPKNIFDDFLKLDVPMYFFEVE